MLLDVIGLRQMIIKYGNDIAPELLEEWLNALHDCRLCIDMLLFDYETIHQKYNKNLV